MPERICDYCGKPIVSHTDAHEFCHDGAHAGAIRDRIDAAIRGAAEHNRKADALLAEANEIVSEALRADLSLTPEHRAFGEVMQRAMPPLEQYVCERTLAKVTFALAHAAERWWSSPGESLGEAVYTVTEMMFNSVYTVRDCRADTPERIAALALAGVEHFSPEADTADAAHALDYLLVAAEGAAAQAWAHPPATGGWIMRLDVDPIRGNARFIFDAEATLPEGGNVHIHDITPRDEDEDHDTLGDV